MNAFALNSMSRAVATRRFMSSTTATTTAVVENMRTKATFKNSWLSDISTYPIITILAVATAGCAGFLTYKFTTCPDVRVASTTKGKVVRNWVAWSMIVSEPERLTPGPNRFGLFFAD